jgi:uncharacterized protein (AIM24 family)
MMTNKPQVPYPPYRQVMDRFAFAEEVDGSDHLIDGSRSSDDSVRGALPSQILTLKLQGNDEIHVAIGTILVIDESVSTTLSAAAGWWFCRPWFVNERCCKLKLKLKKQEERRELINADRNNEPKESAVGFVSLTGASFPAHVLKIKLMGHEKKAAATTAAADGSSSDTGDGVSVIVPTQFIARKDAYIAHRGTNVKLNILTETIDWTNCSPCCTSSAGTLSQRVEGSGSDAILYLAAAGVIVEKVLGDGEEIVASSSSIVAFESSCTIKIFSERSKSAWCVCGGAKLTYSQIIGPGRVYLQALSQERFHRVT